MLFLRTATESKIRSISEKANNFWVPEGTEKLAQKSYLAPSAYASEQSETTPSVNQSSGETYLGELIG